MVIPGASRIGRHTLIEVIAALEVSLRDVRAEVILVDRFPGDATSRAIAERSPWVQILAANPQASVPSLMHTGALHASAALVALLEDHTVPTPGWASAWLTTFERTPGAMMAGGPIALAPGGTNITRAAFSFEYAHFLPPLPHGSAAGANCAFRRSAWASATNGVDPHRLWDFGVLAALRANSAPLACEAALVHHQKPLKWSEALRLRWAYSRIFGAGRAAGFGRWSRLGLGLTSLLLPPLLWVRHARTLAAKAGPKALLCTAPITLSLAVAAALGECIGVLAGPGTAPSTLE